MSDTSAPEEMRERPVGELLKLLSDQTTTLVRKELELAKAELTDKGKQAGAGAGMFGAAGLLAVFAVAAITTALIVAIDSAVTLWLAAVIVAALYAAVAGALAVRGRSQLKAATPPMPEQAIESSKEDVQWAKDQAKSART